jgi:hypothetical protein
VKELCGYFCIVEDKKCKKGGESKAMGEAEVGSGHEIDRDLYGSVDLKLQGRVL